LTRADDRYLLLEERSGIARAMKADLFLSIHADSADTPDAHGATVYTLSDRGSSEEAEHLAASENRADTVNGVSLASTSSSVSAILVDLSQRHSAEMSTNLARLILREGEGRIAFRDRALQSAAFVVLKSPDVPRSFTRRGIFPIRMMPRALPRPLAVAILPRPRRRPSAFTLPARGKRWRQVQRLNHWQSRGCPC
jgi:N-acetylmuramoyl-L-alanine amidase